MKTTIRLCWLPDITGVGGNRRHGHYMADYRAAQAERDAWIGALQEAGYHLRDAAPVHQGRVILHISLVFPRRRALDDDNVIPALKHLRDVLQLSKVQVREGKLPSSWTVTGYAGLFGNDRNVTMGKLSWRFDAKGAPLTVIEVEDA